MRLPVNVVADGWLVGPCVRDLQDQMRMRADYWEYRGTDRRKFLVPYRRALDALAADEPVVIWTSPSWDDRVALWALCFQRLQHRPTEPDLSLVVVGEHEERKPPITFGIGYVSLKPAMARRAWETMRSLSLREVREKALFWKKLTAPSPILSGNPPRETRSRKEFFELGAYQAGFFPRLSERGLSLSTVDTLMLDLVDDTPRTPARIFMREGAKGDVFRQWFDLTGDVIHFKRIVQWATHEPAALIADLHGQPHMWRALYSLTAHGRSLLHDGLTSLDQAPPFPIWGVTAYDRKDPWVVVEEAGGRPHLRRLGEG
ncbi:hypothetical protein [Polyangium jinanense]|uniref:DUF1835 domain-containing protein n=1 Tax=Polyangium jinanense TaxID=2829994 RepID=A0A9X3WYY6_9BACT|nr:hypothetical protein [Polyangium jinanense]MDC3954571.1 hypothetical protein [Polyangium jinanense]MDC3980874.1 hypothetical protein [Polyangium jinanense]